MKNNLVILVFVHISHILLAQHPDSTKVTAPVFVISGGVDGYYAYDFNNPKVAPYNSLTSFTRSSNSFELGMASLRADHKFGKISATIDLGFGTRAEEFAYNDANTRLALKQLYVSYAPAPAIKFTLGTWATHVGYEMVDPWLNRNYSMSYMFTNGPFTHTGLKTDISLGGKTGFMMGVSNPTDYRSAPTRPKSLIGQFSTGSGNDKVKAYFNFLAGKQTDYKKVIQGDIVVTAAVTDKCSIGFNGTLQSVKLDLDSSGKFTNKHWEGAALYLHVDPGSWFGFTVRGEYIRDNDELLGFKNVFAPTISANFKVNNLSIIPEFRYDKARNSVFYKSASETTNSSGSFTLAAVYHFNKEW